MRLIKDEEDIRFLRRVAEMSAQGHIRAMQTAAPGRWEFEVQEAHDGFCARNGSRRMAYPSIAGSGPNSCILHYHQSDRQMKDGEVLLNDSGCEYGFYATDITRTYPVNGKFSPEQRAIYDIVLAAQKAALAVVKPGVSHDEVEKAAAITSAEGLVKLGLLSGDPAQLVKSFGHRKFTLHGVSHWVGFDVHDPNPYALPGQASRPLEGGHGLHDRARDLHSGQRAGRGSEVVEHRRADRGHDPRHSDRLRLSLLRGSEGARGRREGRAVGEEEMSGRAATSGRRRHKDA